MSGSGSGALEDDGGVTAIEYVAVAALATLLLFGPLRAIFDALRAKLTAFAGQL